MQPHQKRCICLICLCCVFLFAVMSSILCVKWRPKIQFSVALTCSCCRPGLLTYFVNILFSYCGCFLHDILKVERCVVPFCVFTEINVWRKSPKFIMLPELYRLRYIPFIVWYVISGCCLWDFTLQWLTEHAIIVRETALACIDVAQSVIDISNGFYCRYS